MEVSNQSSIASHLPFELVEPDLRRIPCLLRHYGEKSQLPLLPY